MGAHGHDPYREPDSDEIAAIVRSTKVAAVVGMKDESQQGAAAFYVPATMKRGGIRVLPVNPTISASLGEPAFRALAEVNVPFDLVQIFRRPELVPAVADEVLALPPDRRPAVVWMQSGIRSDDAAARLEQAGIRVVMDRCYMVEMARVGRPA
jgi:predicted CoA-binding protein